MEVLMAEDHDSFIVRGSLGPNNLSLNIGTIGSFSGSESSLQTFGELIESLREHGQHRAADQLHDGLIEGGFTEDRIQNQQILFTPDGSTSLDVSAVPEEE
jgi:hypothetical protein